ncbi:macro domain-containing protein [Tardiphaga robiniae]|uniref:Thoeris protein ThsA Macro domain-containing protein n=1 Tax=Tardiphaga robiniae TaxID=943830 RepID=A0A164AGK8_9BRAD|nr:macro domain-containing protein [Tardiphaga robiniae]KZD24776.1 hypothetical protein A4A58_20750 [Tardiphaga robiniae]
MVQEVIKSLFVGIQRRWKIGIGRALSVVGAISLLTGIITRVSTAANLWIVDHGTWYLAAVAAAAIVWFIAYTYEKRSVSFAIPTTDSRIDIRFGDLLTEQSDLLIGVGEFFDHEIGHIVSRNSLHGKVIEQVFNGEAARFRLDVDRSIKHLPATKTERSVKPDLKYPIGTTAVVRNGQHQIFLVAMALTDMATSKASSTVPLLWDALRGALSTVKNYGNGATLSLPLIGNGQSSVNIEPQHLLRLIVLALVDYGRRSGLPKQVNIIVPEACFKLLDIREIERDWSKR